MPAAAVDQAVGLFEELKKAFDAGKVQETSALLLKLRLLMTEFGASEKEQLLSREILEIAVLFSVHKEDVAAFDRYIAQLKPFYNLSGNKTQLVESARQYTILGLNLLRLLSHNRIGEFHTELELILPEKHTNVFVKHPVLLEQYLMEGSYKKVVAAREDVPSPSYSYFMTKLIETVRDEMADCSEKAYLSLSTEEAKGLLMFETEEELLRYAESRAWKVENDDMVTRIVFEKEEEPVGKDDIPAMKLMARTLAYAKELERIV